MKSHTYEGRDGRREGTFWIDNEIVEVYAARVGIHALGVYIALVKHSKNNDCFPSTSTLADELGISRPTVSKAIHTLEAAGLVHIEERKLPVRGQTSHFYTILQVNKTAVKQIDSGPDPTAIPGMTAVNEIDSGKQTAVKEVYGPCKGGLQPPVKEVYSINNTNVNKTKLTNDGNAAAAAALVALGFDRKQQAAILASRPELTVGEVVQWQPFIDAPPSWCEKPVGYAYVHLIAGDPVPIERLRAPSSASVNGRRRVPVGDVPDCTVEEAIERGAAATAYAFRGLGLPGLPS